MKIGLSCSIVTWGQNFLLKGMTILRLLQGLRKVNLSNAFMSSSAISDDILIKTNLESTILLYSADPRININITCSFRPSYLPRPCPLSSNSRLSPKERSFLIICSPSHKSVLTLYWRTHHHGIFLPK